MLEKQKLEMGGQTHRQNLNRKTKISKQVAVNLLLLLEALVEFYLHPRNNLKLLNSQLPCSNLVGMGAGLLLVGVEVWYEQNH